jgi:uncharacterized membrane protein
MVEHIVEFLIEGYASLISKEGLVFIISMMPVLELRGGVLAGYWMNLPLLTTSILGVAGNLLPIPFILLFMEKIFEFMEKHKILVRFMRALRERAKHKSKTLVNAEFWGLVLFVAIPLPVTGAWTGAWAAEILQIPRRKAFLAITLGVFGALTIMLIFSYGVLNSIGL